MFFSTKKEVIDLIHKSFRQNPKLIRPRFVIQK
ncbi:MAG: hypothetical protein ACJAWV_000080 [Flammeovirgaceae bacterium]|jgi:hypothetical protein